VEHKINMTMTLNEKNVRDLRKICVESITVPKFINDFEPEINKIVWALTSSMLSSFMEGIQKSVKPEWRCELISEEIMLISEDISKMVNGKRILIIWLFVGSKVEEWIDSAVELDCFESAENLKRILGSSFGNRYYCPWIME
jgi:hypothetical protein